MNTEIVAILKDPVMWSVKPFEPTPIEKAREEVIKMIRDYAELIKDSAFEIRALDAELLIARRRVEAINAELNNIEARLKAGTDNSPLRRALEASLWRTRRQRKKLSAEINALYNKKRGEVKKIKEAKSMMTRLNLIKDDYGVLAQIAAEGEEEGQLVH